jgi:hypothetical protein
VKETKYNVCETIIGLNAFTVLDNHLRPLNVQFTRLYVLVVTVRPSAGQFVRVTLKSEVQFVTGVSQLRAVDRPARL